jgi:pyridoxamine 5'-phosphate oxidase
MTSASDPLTRFGEWFAKAGELPEPTAMALATAAPNGAPSLRMVLLKEWNAQGFVFFTNYDSRKGHELAHNAHVALLFFWPTLQRQIRIEGTAARTSRDESAAYFRTRERGAQIGAWASAQSSEVDEGELERRVVELTREYEGREIPVPPYWGGFRVMPSRFEFWSGRAHRLHERLVFVREENAWRTLRLSP